MLNGSSEGATKGSDRKPGGDVTSQSFGILMLLQSKEVKQG